MRENRPYGLEGGESGSTGLPYPYRTARISAGDPVRAVLSPEGWYILCRGRRPRLQVNSKV
jgi:hypothetical protein